MERRTYDSASNEEKCLRWLQSVPPPQERRAANALSDPLLQLEDIEQEDDLFSITHSPLIDRKTLTYPPDRYSSESPGHRSARFEVNTLHRRLNRRQRQNQLASTSQSSFTSSSSSPLSSKRRHKTHSVDGSPLLHSQLFWDDSRFSSPHDETTVKAADGLKLPQIHQSPSLALTRKQCANAYTPDINVQTVPMTRPAQARSLMGYHNREALKSQSHCVSDLCIQGSAITAEHHSTGQWLNARKRIDQGSPRSVGMRPSVCAVIEGRSLALPSNGFVRPDSTSRSDCSSPGCQHGQTQARSVSLGRRQLSSGMTSRQLSNLDIKQRTDSSVSNLTRQLHVIL